MLWKCLCPKSEFGYFLPLPSKFIRSCVVSHFDDRVGPTVWACLECNGMINMNAAGWAVSEMESDPDRPFVEFPNASFINALNYYRFNILKAHYYFFDFIPLENKISLATLFNKENQNYNQSTILFFFSTIMTASADKVQFLLESSLE